MAKRSRRLCELRDNAFTASEEAHNRMVRERAIYHSTIYNDESVRIGSLRPLVAESLDPRVASSVNRLIPAFVQQAPKIEVFPDQSSSEDLDVIMTGDIENWMMMLDQVDSEDDHLRTLVYHNLVYGTAIAKTYWDWRSNTYRAIAIDPMTFAPDPAGSRIDLEDSDYLCQRNRSTGLKILLRYGIDLRDPWGIFEVDEMWLRKDIAVFAGIRAEESTTPIVRVLMINDMIRDEFVTESPFWYPGFPYAGWRNFHELVPGKAQDFWGYGYGTLLWPEQKILDEVWANIVFIMRRISVGRLLARQGVLDPDVSHLDSGAVIELLEGGDPQTDIQELSAIDIPAALFSIVQFVGTIIDGQVPSNSDAFVGDVPFEGISGKAIANLQQAAYSQLGENLIGFNNFRVRRARQKISLIQQFARRPIAPHLWRGGVDLPDSFPEDARYIGCHAKIRDASMFPDTPAGKWQMLQLILSAGYVIAPDKLIDIFGINDMFTPQDLLAPQPAMQKEKGESGRSSDNQQGLPTGGGS